MKEEMLERNLREFDYSVLSKVKESLLDELLERHRRDNNLRNFESLSQKIISDRILSDDELDSVVAAGKNFPDTDKKF